MRRLEIGSRRTTQATIVLANEPSEQAQAQEAACILQDYIEKISVAHIEIKKIRGYL